MAHKTYEDYAKDKRFTSSDLNVIKLALDDPSITDDDMKYIARHTDNATEIMNIYNLLSSNSPLTNKRRANFKEILSSAPCYSASYLYAVKQLLCSSLDYKIIDKYFIKFTKDKTVSYTAVADLLINVKDENVLDFILDRNNSKDRIDFLMSCAMSGMTFKELNILNDDYDIAFPTLSEYTICKTYEYFDKDFTHIQDAIDIYHLYLDKTTGLSCVDGNTILNAFLAGFSRDDVDNIIFQWSNDAELWIRHFNTLIDLLGDKKPSTELTTMLARETIPLNKIKAIFSNAKEYAPFVRSKDLEKCFINFLANDLTQSQMIDILTMYSSLSEDQLKRIDVIDLSVGEVVSMLQQNKMEERTNIDNLFSEEL